MTPTLLQRLRVWKWGFHGKFGANLPVGKQREHIGNHATGRHSQRAGTFALLRSVIGRTEGPLGEYDSGCEYASLQRPNRSHCTSTQLGICAPPSQ